MIPDTWTLRVLHAETRRPTAGVPVSLIDGAGNPAGYWVSDADGLVAIPKIDAEHVRLRIGLRSEEPIEIDVALLEAGTAEVSAPPSLLPASSGKAERLPVQRATPEPTLATSALTLRFSRLAVLPTDEAGILDASPTGVAVDFFEPPTPAAGGVRYGALLEMELYWQSLGYTSGDLLYTCTLSPGEELPLDVFDARWRWTWGPSRAASRPARPVELIARLIAGTPLANALAGEDGALPLEPFSLATRDIGGLHASATDSVRELVERAGHAASTLRRRALRITEAGPEPAAGSIRRAVKNPDGRRPLAVHFFEPVERFRVGARAVRIRPAVLIPFQLPNLATRAQVQRFGSTLKRVLLERSLVADLDWVVDIGRRPLDPEIAPPVSELRLVVQTDLNVAPVDLRQVWCFLHADSARYAVHFFPAEPTRPVAPGGTLEAPRVTRWVGAIRLADFHEHPLRFPGHLLLENGSRVVLSFAALHVEGRAGDVWKRLLSIRDFVLNKESQAHLASLVALAEAPGLDARETRLLGHIAANLPYYAAALIAVGDPTLRYLSLAKVRDTAGRSLADLIDNRVVGIVGNYIACPLRSLAALPEPVRALFAVPANIRVPDETVLSVPLPGLWLSQQPATQDSDVEATTEVVESEEGRDLRLGSRWRAGRNPGGSSPTADTA